MQERKFSSQKEILQNCKRRRVLSGWVIKMSLIEMTRSKTSDPLLFPVATVVTGCLPLIPRSPTGGLGTTGGSLRSKRLATAASNSFLSQLCKAVLFLKVAADCLMCFALVLDTGLFLTLPFFSRLVLISSSPERFI